MDLIPCRWRREEVEPGRHACVSPKLLNGPRGVPDDKCVGCYCRDHKPQPRPEGPCRHLGRRIGLARCVPCAKKGAGPAEVPIHSCALLGSCAIRARVPGYACCDGCPKRENDWERGEAGSVRHLMYHLFPGGPVWRWNLAQLKARLSLFNGRRRISVAVGDGSASLAEVEAELGAGQAELVEVRNHNAMREMTSFAGLLEWMSAFRGDGDVHFYGHGKGASSWGVYPGVPMWCESMYGANLDYWPLVRKHLRTFPTVGAFKRLWTGVPGSRCKWHYSGTFRWMRNKDLFGRDWRTIEDTYCGAESYPAVHFERDEAACLFGEFGQGGMGLYMADTWDRWARRSWELFRAESEPYLHRPLLLSCILTSCRQRELVHKAIESVRNQTSDEWELVIMDAGVLHGEGAFDRYQCDGRIRVFTTGEDDALRASVGMQAWAINTAVQGNRIRGDLLCYLSDDDVYDPGWFAAVLAAARAEPRQDAWYGWADRGELLAGGQVRPLGVLRHTFTAGPGRSLACKVDGMQVAHRRRAHYSWPEDKSIAHLADAHFMEGLGQHYPIHFLDARVGLHLHTPDSTFTRGSGAPRSG